MPSPQLGLNVDVAQFFIYGWIWGAHGSNEYRLASKGCRGVGEDM